MSGDGNQVRTHLLGQEEILIAVQKGLKNRRVVETVRSSLAPLAANFVVSRSLGDHPPSPHLVVLIGGWGGLPILEAIKEVSARFGACPALAVLMREQGNVAELFASGVSDCVRWPLDRAEFAARARARLHAPAAETEAEIVLDPQHLTIRCNERRATLTHGQFKIVAQLLQGQPHWITSKELLKALGERRTDTTQVRLHVFAIRQKLRGEAWRLRSHRKLGYFFERSRSLPI